MAWMGKAIWESSPLNSMKQYETKGQVTHHIINATPFMSTERKLGWIQRLLRNHDRKPCDTKKHSKKLEGSARSQHLLAGAHAVSGPGNVEITNFQRKFYSNNRWSSPVPVFLATKMPNKKKGISNMRRPLPNTWKIEEMLPEEKLSQKRNNFGVSTVVGLKTESHPQKWFPRVSASNQQFPGQRIQHKMVPQR